MDDEVPADALDFDAMLLRAKLRSKMFGVQQPPTRVGAYEVLGALGSGSMSTVYKARGVRGQLVAVKLLSEKGGDDTPHGQRMTREATALAFLKHENVVGLVERGSFEGRMFLAMELVEGTTLLKWQEAQERPWAEVVEKYRQAAAGLDAAHRAGMVHRDFKPANALLGQDGGVRVVDFGLARAIGGHDTSPSAPGLDVEVTNTGELIGTPAYMSPEQARGEPVDGRADQFSFSVALYEALYGKRPRGEPAARPPRRGVPARVHAAILKGLSKDPTARFATMGLMAEQLRPGASARAWIAIAVVAAGAAAAIAAWQLS